MMSSQVEKWFWLVGGGPMQVPVLKYLREADYKIILTDGNADCPGRVYADIFFELDIHSIQGHLDVINELPGDIRSKIKGVSCIATDSHKTVSAIAMELDLVGITPLLSELIGDKDRLRKLLTEIGVTQPKFLALSNKDEIESVLKRIRETFVHQEEIIIKPLGWSASKGIKKLDDVPSMENEIHNALQISRNGCAVIEEIVVPDGKLASEISIETLVENGKVKFLSTVDRIFAADLPHFQDSRIPQSLNLGVEFAIISPSSRTKTEIDKVLEDLQRLMSHLQKIGAYKNETFILKADILFSTKGPVIIEATPRTSGGWDSSYTSPKRGLKIQALAIEISLGRTVEIEEWITGSKNYVAVVSDANAQSIDCLGRSFFGGELSIDPTSALKSALDARDANLVL